MASNDKAPPKTTIKSTSTKPMIEAKTLHEYAAKANEIAGRSWMLDVRDAIKAGAIKISTGILEFDLATLGGWPYAKFGMISGDERSGKTATALCSAYNALMTCRWCYTPIIEFVNYQTGEIASTCACGKNDHCNTIFVDAENRLDGVRAKLHGLPVDKSSPLYSKFALAKPFSGDAMADIARDMISQNIVDFMVIDSYASLFPEARVGRTSMAQQPGDSAKMLQNLLFTILNENIRQGEDLQQDGLVRHNRQCTTIGVQQIRAVIGQNYGGAPQTTTPGGYFARHSRTTHAALNAAKRDEGIKNEFRTDDSTHYVDFHGSLKKASLGGGEGLHFNWRLYVKPYRGIQAGETDSYLRLAALLKTYGMCGKDESAKKGFHVLGIHFETNEKAMAALRKSAAMYRAGLYAILYNTLHPNVRDYLNIDLYDYNPFYTLEVADVQKIETDFDVKELTQFRLAPRIVPRGHASSARKKKTIPKADADLARLNPPPVPADHERPA